jgi:hypothetical protein
VNFAPAAAGGVVSTPSATTDAQGYAQTLFTLPQTYTTAAAVTASSLGAANVTFTAVWRGVVVTYLPIFSYLNVIVRHSELNSPVTLCWETPPPPSPYAMTAWGDIWTSVISPVPGLGALDGLGLLGPADPTVKTGSTQPQWGITVTPLPPFGGLALRLQAYAIHVALYPAPESIMISNAPTLTMN